MLSMVIASSGVLAAQAPAATAGRSSGPAQPSSGPQMGPWEWWNDPAAQKELGLSAEKIKQIDDLFERRSRDLKPMVEELQRQRLDLDKMTQAAVTDEPIYSLQVFRVESLQARLRESRTMMLYRMYRMLQPEQYKKLQIIMDRHYGHNPSNVPSRGRE